MAFHHAKDSRLRSAMDAFARMELPDFDVVKRTYNIIEVSFLADRIAPTLAA